MLNEREIEDYIESGIIELVTMNLAEERERELSFEMAAEYPAVQQAFNDFAAIFESYIQKQAVPPGRDMKALIMAIVDFQERIADDEIVDVPPLLHAGSLPADYLRWLEKTAGPDPTSSDNLYARIFTLNPVSTLGVVWIKTETVVETHEDQFESFLILEGSCKIIVGNNSYELGVGDYFQIPLFSPHQIIVTSAIPCKAILQRLAA